MKTGSAVVTHDEGFALLQDGKRHWLGGGCNPLCGQQDWWFETIIDTNRHNPLNCPQCVQLVEANEAARGVMAV